MRFDPGIVHQLILIKPINEYRLVDESGASYHVFLFYVVGFYTTVEGQFSPIILCFRGGYT